MRNHVVSGKSLCTLLSEASISEKEISRFLKSVRRDDPDKCWPWCGTRGERGYGHFGFRYKIVGAHRIAWVIENGYLPEGVWVLHHCDNPPCCNPSHLFLGTPKDNSADMVRKGRAKWSVKGLLHLRGEENPRAKLDKAKIKEIRSRRSLGQSYQTIAISYGVSANAIWHVIQRKTWGHVS